MSHFRKTLSCVACYPLINRKQTVFALVIKHIHFYEKDAIDAVC